MDAEYSPLSELERTILAVALAPDSPGNARLREQAAAARVTTRTASGVGFMTRLQVPEGLALTGRHADDVLPVLFGAHPELPAGAEFVLQLKAGRLNTIEAFCYEGTWPGDESGFRVELRP